MLIYEGPSLLTGDLIVAIVTPSSGNEKTGDMMQTWILPRDVAPHEAVKTGADAAVCGDCPHRHYNGGACYVLPFQGPRAVWQAWRDGSYEKPAHVRKVRKALDSGKMIRLGAYGDPAAVPASVWYTLLAGGNAWTGYTHQWQNPVAEPLRELCMASVDSRAEAHQAAAEGWRYFQVLGPDDGETRGSIECLSDAQDRNCVDCGICNGARPNKARQPVSVYIDVHGSKAKRFKPKALRVIQ